MPAALAYLSSGSEDEPADRENRQRSHLRAVDGDGPTPSARPRRALVVDDEASMRLLFKVNLTLYGFEVVEAANGLEGLARAREQRFDVIVLDVMMPELSGFDLAEQLRGEPVTADVPFVFVSARADDADIQRGLELGASDYIVKPFDPLTLGPRLDGIVNGRRGA